MQEECTLIVGEPGAVKDTLQRFTTVASNPTHGTSMARMDNPGRLTVVGMADAPRRKTVESPQT